MTQKKPSKLQQGLKKVFDLFRKPNDRVIEVDDVTAEFLREKQRLYYEGKLNLVPYKSLFTTDTPEEEKQEEPPKQVWRKKFNL